MSDLSAFPRNNAVHLPNAAEAHQGDQELHHAVSVAAKRVDCSTDERGGEESRSPHAQHPRRRLRAETWRTLLPSELCQLTCPDPLCAAEIGGCYPRVLSQALAPNRTGAVVPAPQNDDTPPNSMDKQICCVCLKQERGGISRKGGLLTGAAGVEQVPKDSEMRNWRQNWRQALNFNANKTNTGKINPSVFRLT